MSYDFFKKSKTIGTFLNDAEKIVYKTINPYRTNLIIYKVNQKAKTIFLSHIDEYKENLIEKLEKNFGDKFVIDK